MEGMRELMQRLNPHDLSLYVRFQRMGVAPPPETKTLIERRKAGATVAELEAYVRDAFPKDAARAPGRDAVDTQRAAGRGGGPLDGYLEGQRQLPP